MRRTLLALTALALATPVSLSRPMAPAPDPGLTLTYEIGPNAIRYRAHVENAVGKAVVLVGHPCSAPADFDLNQAAVFSAQMLIGDQLVIEMQTHKQTMMQYGPVPMHFKAIVVTQDGFLSMSPAKPLVLGAIPCETLSFNFTADGDPIPAGATIAEQYASLGLHISAVNKFPGHPDKVITFDSANPSPGDLDLMTPGPGLNNDTPLGNLLIVAENDVDADMDGLVDVPDDEAGGGIITMQFDAPVTFCAITLVDLDDGGGSVIRFFDSSNVQISTVPLPPGGDNSVFTVGSNVPGVSRMEVDFVSSGGIAKFDFVFCPVVVGFDGTSSGVPTELDKGETVTNQFASLGMLVSAESDGAVDKAILFDADNPSGGDGDLAAGDGLVLIIAENDVDMNGDGFVDVPDDEANGGTLIFDFTFDVTFQGATVLDIDVGEFAFFEAYDGGGLLIDTVPLQALGNGSKQSVSETIPGVRRLELHLSSSGALGELRFCPELIEEPPQA